MNELSRAELAELLDSHGATPERWPEAHRDAALALLREDAVAAESWQAALELEAALDDWATTEPDADLALRIAAAAPERDSLADVVALPALRLWQCAVLASVPVLIGFLIAVTQVDGSAAARQAEAELAWASAYGLLAPQTEAAP